jgi:hypothetical protein
MLRIARRQPARIAAMAVVAPGEPISNREVVGRFAREGRRGPRSESELDELAELMGEQLGVRSRYWASVPGDALASDRQTSVDLQSRALRAALDEAGVAAGDLGAVLCARRARLRDARARTVHASPRASVHGARRWTSAWAARPVSIRSRRDACSRRRPVSRSR